MYRTKQNNHGFTLLELLLVVAIISLLLSMGLPIYNNLIEESNAKECLTNRILIQKTISLEKFTQPNKVEKNIAVAVLEAAAADGTPYFSTPCICHSGGFYHYDEATKSIVCSIHNGNGNTPVEPGVRQDAEGVRDNMQAVIEEYYKNPSAFYQKYKDKNGLKDFILQGIRNDDIRKVLFNEVYPDPTGWPQFSEEFKKRYGLSGNYYIQPFISEASLKGENKDNSIIIFAHPTNTPDGHWYCSFVYDYEEKVWYAYVKADKSTLDSISINSQYGTYQNWKDRRDAENWIPIYDRIIKK